MATAESDDDALRFDPFDEERDTPATIEREPGFWLTALFGGLYLIWGIAWVVGLANLPGGYASGVVDAALFGVGQFLAYIAAPLWFVATLALGQDWSQRRRFGAMVLGLALLMPWPFILPAVIG